jgi:hypothetical protein
MEVNSEVTIYIEPLGGLGNQLFVYATGRARAIDLNTDLQVDLRNFRNYEWHNFELQTFHSQLSISESARFPKELIRRGSDWSRRGFRRIGMKPRFGSQNCAIEESTVFDSRINKIPDGTTIRGYFQSHLYFDRHAAAIREEIRNLVNPSHWFLETFDALNALPVWSAIHVRRGNYVGLSNMGLAQDDYYSRALRLLRLNVNSGPLLVFSDDIEAAKSMAALQLTPSLIQFIEPPSESSPLESLLLMSSAHNLITANSSFSWWSAWIGDNEDRMVICPRPWLDDPNFNERDLLPPNWITLGRA